MNKMTNPKGIIAIQDFSDKIAAARKGRKQHARL